MLPGTAVTWESLTPNTVTVVSSVNTADSFGRVSATVRLGSVSGAGQIRLRAGSAETLFNVTASVPIATLNKISGDNQSAILNQAFANPLVVEVRNAQEFLAQARGDRGELGWGRPCWRSKMWSTLARNPPDPRVSRGRRPPT